MLFRKQKFSCRKSELLGTHCVQLLHCTSLESCLISTVAASSAASLVFGSNTDILRRYGLGILEGELEGYE